jgi:hypothetical protein
MTSTGNLVHLMETQATETPWERSEQKTGQG